MQGAIEKKKIILNSEYAYLFYYIRGLLMQDWCTTPVTHRDIEGETEAGRP